MAPMRCWGASIPCLLCTALFKLLPQSPFTDIWYPCISFSSDSHQCHSCSLHYPSSRDRVTGVIYSVMCSSQFVKASLSSCVQANNVESRAFESYTACKMWALKMWAITDAAQNVSSFLNFSYTSLSLCKIFLIVRVLHKSVISGIHSVCHESQVALSYALLIFRSSPSTVFPKVNTVMLQVMSDQQQTKIMRENSWKS